MSAIPWYLDPISKSFNGGTEKGVDLKVPFHTPITPLFPGTVTGVKTGPYGQEVDVAGVLNGQRVTASYVHLDQALVGVGQQVGQNSELGVSGGQLSGGLHPASPAYSSGPHIEFSLWPQGTTPYGGTPYNPMQFIQGIQASQGASLAGMDTSASLSAQGGLSALQNLLSLLGSTPGSQASQSGGTLINIQPPDIAGGLRSAGNSLLGVFGGVGTDARAKLRDLLWRVGLIVVALILIWVVAQALSAKATQDVTESVINSKPVQAVGRVAALAK